jgi:2-C-methyl-D-erythritol 4-phosphate cytidylyltransferase
MDTFAIIVAAGLGTRMGAAVPKALMPLAGRPMVAWSLDALVAADGIDTIVVVAPPGREMEMTEAIGDSVVRVVVVPGGSTRARSVAEGLAAGPSGAATVLVHDAARPLVTPAVVTAVLGALDGVDGAIAAAPLADTLKREDPPGIIGETLDRAGLWLAQTPQAFDRQALVSAFAAADGATLDRATDCAWLVEQAGGRVRLVDPGVPNFKVTTPSDLVLAEALLARSGAN